MIAIDPLADLHPLAVLPVEMPVLRLQQPCPRAASTRRAGPARCWPISTGRPRWRRTARSCSIFFGGGTPSLMPPETVAALIERVKTHWPVAPDLEITLEANPNSAEAERFAGFAAAGVNRLSLGVQALDPEALKFLGRAHDRDEAIARDRPRPRHFPALSFDLIYARPGQSARRLGGASSTRR